MSGNESTAEMLYELGIELVNPGGRPEELRQAAKAWRLLQKQVAGAGGVLKDVDKAVENTVGESWRGPAAEAFRKHWREVREAVEKAAEDYDEVAKQLDEAADQIEEVNSEIHGIYLEIGVSIGVGIALSFVTVGLGSAAAAARVTMLATRAIRLSERLGRLLHGIASRMRAFQQSGNLAKLLMNFGVNWGGNTFGSAIGAAASGDGLTGAELGEAAWQGGVAAAVGTPLGMGTAAWAGARLGSIPAVGAVGRHVGENMAGGIVGNVAGGGAVDGITALSTDEKPEWLKNSLVNAAGGGLGGAGMGAVGVSRQRALDTDFTPPPDFDQSKVPGGGRRGGGPHFAIDVPMGGAGAAVAGGGGEVMASKPPAEDDGSRNRVGTGNQAPPRQRSIRDDFG
ncbi:WXG100 family type VII secretion target [Streptomyces hypolithicus]